MRAFRRGHPLTHVEGEIYRHHPYAVCKGRTSVLLTGLRALVRRVALPGVNDHDGGRRLACGALAGERWVP